MTREHAESCGQNQARCGELVAMGDLSGFPAHRLKRKIVSMEALEQCAASDHRASVEIRTPVQSLAAHSKATR
jgi:hypothetical protein